MLALIAQYLYYACICTVFYSYVHRVGRTARAGRAGYAVTFVTDNDRSLLKAIVSTLLFLTLNLVFVVRIFFFFPLSGLLGCSFVEIFFLFFERMFFVVTFL